MTIEEYLDRLEEAELMYGSESLEEVLNYRNEGENSATISVFIETNTNPFEAELKVSNFDNIDEVDLNAQLMYQIVKNANRECNWDWEGDTDSLTICSETLRVAREQIEYLGG